MKSLYSKIGKCILLYLFGGYLFQLIYTTVLTELFGEVIVGETWYLWCSMLIPVYLLSFPLSVLAFRRIETAPMEIHKLSGKHFIDCILIGVFLSGTGSLLGILIESFLVSAPGAGSNAVEELLLQSDLFWRVLCVGVAAPIVEELVFRKLLIDRVICAGEKITVFLSGFLFALSHGNFSQFFYTFFLGMLWAYIYVRTGRVIYMILLHMILNLSSSVITVFVLELGGMYQWAWYGALCVMAIAGMVVLIRNRRKFYFKAALQEPWCKVFLNAGMIAYISFCVGLFLLTYAE